MTQISHTYLHIECLSPVHVGDGQTRKGEQELLFYNGEREKKAYGSALLALADTHKLMERTPGSSLREKAVRLTGMVEGGEDFLKLFSVRNKPPFPSEVASKALVFEGRGVSWNPAAGFIGMVQSGRGLPLLPGSSLKGAIVTGIFAEKVRELRSRPWKSGRKVRFFAKKEDRDVLAYDDKLLWKSVFGRDPNDSFLRYLRIGDIEFLHSRAYGTTLLNLVRRGWIKDEAKSLFVEALPEGAKAVFRYSFPQRVAELARNKGEGQPWPYQGWPALAACLNAHTMRLLREELSFIDKQADSLLAPLQERLENLLEKAENAPSGHCLLRVGYGSGWRFMSGFWQEDYFDEEELNGMYDRVCRYKHYQEETPKTRRVLGDARPLGFVWIRPSSEGEAREHHQKLTAQAKIDPMAAYGPFEEEAQLDFTPHPLRKGMEVKAICLGPVPGKSGHKSFDLFVGPEDGSGKQKVEMRFPSDVLQEGTPVLLRLQDVDRAGKVRAVSMRKLL